MKKLFITIMAICLLMTTAIVSEAASLTNTVSNQIAVVIVGSADYKTKEFLNLTKDYFKPIDKSSVITVLSGKDVQNKYQKYWFDKGLIDEGTPTKEDFVEFVNYSGYNKVIYLVIKDSVRTAWQKEGKRSFPYFTQR